MQDIQEMQAWFLGREDPLEEKMATHSSILIWRIPWTEEHGDLQYIVRKELLKYIVEYIVEIYSWKELCVTEVT